MIKRIVMSTLLLGGGLASSGTQDVLQQVAPAPPEIGIVALDPINVGRVVRGRRTQPMPLPKRRRCWPTAIVSSSARPRP